METPIYRSYMFFFEASWIAHPRWQLGFSQDIAIWNDWKMTINHCILGQDLEQTLYVLDFPVRHLTMLDLGLPFGYLTELLKNVNLQTISTDLTKCCFNGDFPSQTSQKFLKKQMFYVSCGTVLPCLPKGKCPSVCWSLSPFWLDMLVSDRHSLVAKFRRVDDCKPFT